MPSYLPNFINPQAWTNDSKMTFLPVSDFSGYDYTLANAGSMGGLWTTTGTSQVVGYFGNGTYMAGGQCLAMADNAALKLNDFTAELWFKRDGWGTNNARIIDKSYFDFEVNRVGSTNNIEFACRLVWLSCPTTIADATWYHLAVSRSGTIGSIFINGYLVNSGAVGAETLDTVNPLLLGKNSINTTEYFNGVVDEVRLWNYARSSGDITANYNNDQFNCNQNGLIICSKFDTDVRLFRGLSQGSVFTGQAAFWFDQNKNNFQIKRISGENTISYIGMPSDFSTGYFSPSATLSQDKNRITNVTAALDNTCSLVMGYQDNGDSNVGFLNKPQIIIGYASGNKITGWRGWNPTLFNNVQINYPYKVPNILTGTFMTGSIVCHYTNENGSNLYARYESDNFSTEYLINSGLYSGIETQKLNFNPIFSPNSYFSYQKTMTRKDIYGNVIVLTSKPTINFASDTFENYQTGILSGFSGGYGLFKRENSFGVTSGFVIPSGN
jgi:hypothetical protein